MLRQFLSLMLVIIFALAGLLYPTLGRAASVLPLAPHSPAPSGWRGVFGDRVPIEPASETVGPLSVAIAGPVTGVSVNDPRTWTATTAPLDVSVPVTYTWQATEQSPIIHSGTTTDTISFAWTLPGVKTITVTAANDAGTVQDTHEVTVDTPIAGLDATGTNPTTCGYYTTFSATIAQGTSVSYTWSFGDGQLGSGPVVAHRYGALGTFTATLTATNPVSTATDQAVVVVVEEPITNLRAASTSPDSTGESTTFTAIINTGTNVAYRWNFGDGSAPVSGKPVSYVYASAGIYTAVVTASNSVSTQYTTTLVTVQDSVAGLQIDDDSPTYIGESTAFTATLTAGTAASFAWTFGDGQSASGQVVSHTYAALGSYTAAVTATNLVSSQHVTKTATVVDVPLAGLHAASDGPTPLEQATAFTATVSAGTSVAYAWAFGDGQMGSGAVTSHTYGAVGTYTATVTATNSVGSLVDHVSVLVHDVPIAGLAVANNGPTPLGSPTVLSATISAGTSVQYDWAFGDGQSGTGQTPSHQYGAVGTYTATVTATNSVGSSRAQTVVVVAETISGLTATSSSPTVLGHTTTLTATVSSGSGVSYAWAFGDGQTGSGATVSHVYGAVGTYTAIVTATNAVSAQSKTTAVVVDVPITGLTADNSSPTARGTQTLLIATLSTGSNEQYRWNFGDGSATASGFYATHVYPAAGLYTATVTATNSVSTQWTQTAVLIQDAISGLTATNGSPTQLGGTTALSATVTVGTAVAYTWQFGDSQNGAGQYTAHTYGAVRSYTATVTAQNLVSTRTANTLVTIVDVPIADLSVDSDSPTVLGSDTVLIANVSAGTNVGYAWAFGDGQQGAGPVVSHPYTEAGTYTATVTATNSVSSVAAQTVVLVEQAIAGLSAQSDGATALGTPTGLSASVQYGTGVSYAWAFGDGAVGSGRTVQYTYGAVGTYTATVTATNSVSSVAAQTVVLVEQAIAGLEAESDGATALGTPTGLSASVQHGTGVSYAWALGDGSVGSGRTVQHTYGAVGTYTATVTATNSVSSVAAQTVVLVEQAIVGLEAESDGATELGVPTSLSASVLQGTGVSYAWAFGDGAAGSGQTVQHTYGAVGTYTASVTATNQVSHAVAQTVVPVDLALVGFAAENSGPTIAGSTTYLTATATAGSNLAFVWTLGDGADAEGPAVAHVYALAGTYTATVTATNSLGLDFAETVVMVEPAIHYVYAPCVLKDFVCAADPYEPNDDPQHAYLLTGNTTLLANFCETGQKDEYKFHIATTGTPIEIGLRHIPSGCDYDVYLYQLPDTTAPKAWSDATGNVDEHISYRPTQAGDYMVFVYATTKCTDAGSSNYLLQVDFE